MSDLDFSPTFLYIKRHRKTGLKYLGKTSDQRKNPYKYLGSGRHWTNHLKIHGKEIDTVWCQLFTDKNLCVETALFLSDFYKVVVSKEWANEKPENGLDGGFNGYNQGMTGKKQKEASKKLMSIAKAGSNNPNYGKTYTEEESKKFGHTKNVGSKRTAAQKETMSINHADVAGKNNPMYGKKHKESTLLLIKIPKVRVTRLIDKKEMSVNHYTRWIKRSIE